MITAKINHEELDIAIRMLAMMQKLGNNFGDNYQVYEKPWVDLSVKITAQHFEHGELSLTEEEFEHLMDAAAAMIDVLWWMDRHAKEQSIMDFYQRLGQLSIGYIDENGVYQYYDDTADS